MTVFSGRPATDLQSVGLWLSFIFYLLFISAFAGLLPVFSCALGCNSLIINTIHFSGLHAFCWYLVGFLGARKRARAEGQPKGLYAGSISGIFMCFGV